LDNLEAFVSTNGRAFYKRPVGMTGRTLTLQKVEYGGLVEEKYELEDGSLIPFWAGKKIDWDIL
jgi:dihydroorotase